MLVVYPTRVLYLVACNNESREMQTGVLALVVGSTISTCRVYILPVILIK
jgi:hypothetical protein